MKTETNFFSRDSTVLVVDDAPDSLSLINDTLEQAGINTLVALDGKQAINIAKRIRPDIILLDAVMPVLDGFETCRLLKTIPSLASVPVIFMTGLSDTESVVRGLQAGGVDYLTKPVSPEELMARMQVHLENAQLAVSAQQALDSLGQNLIALDAGGELQWATPQAHGLLAKTGASQAWQDSTLAPRVTRWLATQPPAHSSLTLKTEQASLELTLIEYRNEREILFKLNDDQRSGGPEKLQKNLNITKRESEVLFWLANGKTNKEIAQILDMGVRTVNKHLEQIFPKLGVENRTAAAGIAIRSLR